MRHNFLILAILLILFSIPSAVYACRCKMPTASNAYKNAAVVAVVVAESVQKLEEEKQTAVLRVSQVWKQDVPALINVSAGGKVCGYFFEENKEYIVYLSKNKAGEFSTQNCVGNKSVNQPQFPLLTKLAKEDISWLKKNGKAGRINAEKGKVSHPFNSIFSFENQNPFGFLKSSYFSDFLPLSFIETSQLKF